ncbi:MAG TPA: DUF1015 domain-containing protein [Aggregatilinea sp.]|uniref:DUF1015 domain-containing protein n=1 Tax=Aggregatilinea sp. TaxID=2806333 RepID=UPI002B7FCF65|nr:DUF1015 domain-containing protein [Aggregatilinea sp.]HML25024.1 DUF1015 domain-containing protein [Aggregatilinea sp.]
MAVIKPFRGVRYNAARVGDLQSVVSQPYDRISDDLQDRYYALSPYNIVRIIQGKTEPGDSSEGPNVYTRAKSFYQDWRAEDVLARDEHPAVYAYEQTFTVEGKQYVRLGMIAAVKLAEFDEGIILPHERTHAGPKEDRLRLINTLQAHTEQIFLLYPDAENRVNALLRQAIGSRQPDLDVEELLESGVRQRMWAITDEPTLAAIEAEMDPKRNLIIADGHHRYETALNYRNAQRAAHPDASPDAAFNYVAATLVSMDDPGLVVLPTHREICNFTTTSPADVLERAKLYFNAKPVADLPACLDALNASGAPHVFGYYGGPDVGFYTLTLQDSALIDRLITSDQSPEWKSLAVSIAHRILIEQVAGVPVEGVEDKSMLRYHRRAQEAVESVDRGEGNFVFFLRPTRMDSIKAIAGRGEKMPQKSTDFYPKMISGLVLMPLDPGEQV